MSDRHRAKHDFESDKLAKRLRRLTGQAIVDFNMIEAGRSRHGLPLRRQGFVHAARHAAPVAGESAGGFRTGRGASGSEAARLRSPTCCRTICARSAMPFEIIEQDTYSVVKRVVPEGKTMCGLCSRLRRGALYSHAAKNGFTKIALGHHRDDIVETMFLNMFHHTDVEGDAAEAAVGRRQARRDPAARLLQGRRHRRVRRAAGVPDHAVQPVRLAGNAAAQSREADAGASGNASIPGRTENVFRALTVDRAVATRRSRPVRFRFARQPRCRVAREHRRLARRFRHSGGCGRRHRLIFSPADRPIFPWGSFEMWFRNLTLFRFSEKSARALKSLESKLDGHRLREVGPQELSTRRLRLAVRDQRGNAGSSGRPLRAGHARPQRKIAARSGR